MTESVDLTEFHAAFLVEAEEHTRNANVQLLAIDAALRAGETHPRAVRELFRALHTIKGLSAMVGVEPIVALAHRMEAALRTADRANGRLALPAVDVLLQGVRAIEQRVRALGESKPITAPPTSLLDALDALEPHAPPPEVLAAVTLEIDPAIGNKLAAFEREQLVRGVDAGRRAVRVDFTPSSERAAAGITIASVRERIGKLSEIVKVVPVATPLSESSPGGLSFALLVLTERPDEALAEAASVPLACVRLLGRGAPPPPPPEELPEVEVAELEPHHSGVVRVSVERLDDAMEQLSALIVTRARLVRAVAELTANGVNTRALSQIVQDNARQLRDLRAAILRVRMVPVSEALERVPLIVRGMRRASGKQVRLELDTGHAELDKAVAEQIFPAIVHLVRNAIDHAIESPEERRKAGKPDEGRLVIACFSRSNTQLELTITDDGRGVDREAVARRAGKEVPTNDAALLQLLCRPGLSTREEASTTSGRGMGMDIVRRITVDQLGGELSMSTAPGVGTTFTLRVPLTIMIVEAFAFECGAQRFVVPLAMIDEIIEVDPARVVRGPSAARSDVGMIERRGAAVPLVRLDTVFGLGASGAGLKALVVRRGGETVAYAVDRMLGQQEVVVRPLTDPMLRVRGITGATDLGDGRPTLVLDLVSLTATLAAENAS